MSYHSYCNTNSEKSKPFLLGRSPMNIIGIVSEYNPFHRGHEYQINESRRLLGDDALIICVMSGDFVQRGDAAVFSKFARAEAACRCGADLVFELPLPWALSSAEGFAGAGVYILGGLGCTHLSFGSEGGRLEELESLACCLERPETVDRVKKLLLSAPNMSFASARQRVLEDMLGPSARLIETPNNILAVEYLKAIHRYFPAVQAVTVKRRGSGHDQPGSGPFRSASELRRLLKQGDELSEYMPAGATAVFSRELEQGRAVINRRDMELVIMSRLRMLEEDSYQRLPDGGNGVGRRLYAAVRAEAGLEQVLEHAKNKRVPLSRLRRMCFAAALGLDKNMAEGLPPYARLLAGTEKGRAYLGGMRGKTTIPVVTKPAAVKDIGDEALKVFALGASAHDMYSLMFLADSDKKCGSDWRCGPKFVEFI